MSSTSVFLQEMSYPPYCLQPLKSWGMIAVGGGGGTAKTGVSNAVDLKWVDLSHTTNPENQKCAVQNVSSFSQCDSVMRMVSLRKQNEYLILALNRHLKVIMLKASQVDGDEELCNSTSPSTPAASNTLDVPSLATSIRRRKSSSTSDAGSFKRRSSTMLHRHGQATVEAIGDKTPLSTSPTSITPTTRSNPFSRLSSTSSAASVIMNNIYTVPVQEHEYVNAIVVCPVTQSKLFVGASDGSLTIYEIIWPALSSSDRLIHLNVLTSFTVHRKEIDDLAIDPFGTWVVSTSRDHHVQIRQCSPPFDKHSELDLRQFGENRSTSPAKLLYRVRHVRFGVAPTSSNATCFLYTSLIPQSSADQLASYLVQWYEKKHGQFTVRSRRRVSHDRISAICVSDCGRFASVGDSVGCVRIYETDRFILLYEHRSHAIFVTDLAFIFREENYVYETSVLSISADKNLYVHNIHSARANLFSVSFLIATGLFFLFMFLSQVRFTYQ